MQDLTDAGEQKAERRERQRKRVFVIALQSSSNRVDVVVY